MSLWKGNFHKLPTIRPTIAGWDICVPTRLGLKVYKVQFHPEWVISKFPLKDAFYWCWAMCEQKDGGQLYGAWTAWQSEQERWVDPVAAPAGGGAETL